MNMLVKWTLDKFKSPILYRNVAVLVIVFIAGGCFGQSRYFLGSVLGNPLLPNSSNAYIYNRVWNLLHQDYYSKNLDDNKLVYSSIEGMVSSLNDPATVFLPPESSQSFKNLTAGNNFAGIGVQLSCKNNRTIVERLIPNSPALESGVKVGSAIYKVDGQVFDEDCNKTNIENVENKIRGVANTNVNITFKTVGSDDIYVLNIKRRSIHVDSMYLTKKNDKDGNQIDYLNISRFTDDDITTWEKNWDNSVNTILNDNPKGLIIDLRGNPGGFFDAAIYALSDFLPKNTIAAYQQDRLGNKITFRTLTDPKLPNINIKILVDSNTASAAEIFSGALQYYKKAQLIGTSTYGKGTAQEVLDFSDGSSVHITTDHWLLPSQKWIQHSDPIKPNITVETTDEDYNRGEDVQLDRAIYEF